MKTKNNNKQPEKPIVEYTAEEYESNTINDVFDQLFEQIEKEIRSNNKD